LVSVRTYALVRHAKATRSTCARITLLSKRALCWARLPAISGMALRIRGNDRFRAEEHRLRVVAGLPVEGSGHSIRVRRCAPDPTVGRVQTGNHAPGECQIAYVFLDETGRDVCVAPELPLECERSCCGAMRLACGEGVERNWFGVLCSSGLSESETWRRLDSCNGVIERTVGHAHSCQDGSMPYTTASSANPPSGCCIADLARSMFSWYSDGRARASSAEAAGRQLTGRGEGISPVPAVTLRVCVRCFS